MKRRRRQVGRLRPPVLLRRHWGGAGDPGAHPRQAPGGVCVGNRRGLHQAHQGQASVAPASRRPHLGRPRGGGSGGEESRPGGESPDSRHGGPAVPGFLPHRPVARPRRPTRGAVPGHGGVLLEDPVAASRPALGVPLRERRHGTGALRRGVQGARRRPDHGVRLGLRVDIAAPAVVALPVHLAGHGGPGVREAAPVGETRVLSATAIGGAPAAGERACGRRPPVPPVRGGGPAQVAVRHHAGRGRCRPPGTEEGQTEAVAGGRPIPGASPPGTTRRRR